MYIASLSHQKSHIKGYKNSSTVVSTWGSQCLRSDKPLTWKNMKNGENREQQIGPSQLCVCGPTVHSIQSVSPLRLLLTTFIFNAPTLMAGGKWFYAQDSCLQLLHTVLLGEKVLNGCHFEVVWSSSVKQNCCAAHYLHVTWHMNFTLADMLFVHHLKWILLYIRMFK